MNGLNYISGDFMKKIFALLLLLSLQSCAKPSLKIDPIVLKGKKFDYTISDSSFKSHSVAATFLGVSEITSSEGLTSGEEIKRKYNLKNPIENFKELVLSGIEKKYGMKRGTEIIPADLSLFDQKILKHPERYSVSLHSFWGIRGNLFYGPLYEYHYSVGYSITDNESKDETINYGGRIMSYKKSVLSANCTYNGEEKHTYDEFTKDNAKILKDYTSKAEAKCKDELEEKLK